MCLNPQVLTGTSLLIFLYNVNFTQTGKVVAEFLLTKFIASSLCIAFSLEQGSVQLVQVKYYWGRPKIFFHFSFFIENLGQGGQEPLCFPSPLIDQYLLLFHPAISISNNSIVLSTNLFSILYLRVFCNTSNISNLKLVKVRTLLHFILVMGIVILNLQMTLVDNKELSYPNLWE